MHLNPTGADVIATSGICPKYADVRARCHICLSKYRLAAPNATFSGMYTMSYTLMMYYLIIHDRIYEYL